MVCSRECAFIFWDKKASVPAVSVTRHVVSLLDGGIHIVSGELKLIRHACFDTESTKSKLVTSQR